MTATGRWIGGLALMACLLSQPSPTHAGPTVGEAAVGQRFPEATHRVITLRLWPDQAPDEPRPFGEENVTLGPRHGGDRIGVVTRPSAIVVQPKHFSGDTAAVFVCPGGGYGSLGVDSGGTDVIRWLNGLGITGIYLKYRVPKRHQGFPMHHHALQDIQRAVSLVRFRAEELRIDANRVGVIGFSAGGNLAAMLGTHHRPEDRMYTPINDLDRLSCRPDFVMLVAAAYLTMPILSHDLDPQLHVDRTARNLTPPFFITSASTDKFTVGSSLFALALRERRVSVEVHFYEYGGHAEGVTERENNRWFDQATDWLRRRGILDKAAHER